jgi:hypothetical protein
MDFFEGGVPSSGLVILGRSYPVKPPAVFRPEPGSEQAAALQFPPNSF